MMNVILKNKITGHFIATGCRWTEDEDQAHKFRNIEEVLEFLEQNRLTGISIVVYFTATGQQIVLGASA